MIRKKLQKKPKLEVVLRYVFEALQKVDVIEYLKVRSGENVKVRFTDGIVEYWPIFGCRRRPKNRRFRVGNLSAGEIPEIEQDPVTGSFLVKSKSLRKCGVVEERITLHRLLYRLLNQRWEPVKYPEWYLQHEIRRLLAERIDRFMVGRKLVLRPSTIGSILVHGFPFYADYKEGTRPTIQEAMRRPKLLFRILDDLFVARRDVNPRSFLEQAAVSSVIRTDLVGPKWTPPGFYRRLFRELPIKRINDEHPGIGIKAIAAMSMGISYAPKPGSELDLHRAEVEKILGEPLATWSDDAVHLVDFNMVKQQQPAVWPFLNQRRLLLYVEKGLRDLVVSERRPNMSFYTELAVGTTGFFLLFDPQR